MAVWDNLIHCWNLEEASGNRIDDIGSMDLTPINTPGNAAGKVNNAVSLVRASNHGLVSTTGPFTESAPFSIACWFRFATIPASDVMAVFSRGASTSAGQYNFIALILDTGQLQVAFGVGFGGVISHSPALAVNTWHYMGLTHDGVTLRLKVNNDAWDSQTVGFGSVGPGGEFNIGAIGSTVAPTNGTNHFDGLIDSFKIWNVAKSDADIEADWNLGNGTGCEAPPPVPDLSWLTRPSRVVARALVSSRMSWVIPPPAAQESEPEDTTCTDDREARVRFLLGRKMFDARFPQALLSQNVLRGERDVAVQSLAFQERTTQRLTVGVQAYALPLDYITSWALQIAKFSAGLRLYDSAGVAWYLIVTPAGDVSFASSQPSVILGGAGLRAYTLIDEFLTTQYIYPSTSGVVTMSTTSPGTPIQTAGAQLRDTYGTPWYLDVTTIDPMTVEAHLAVTASRTGSATLLPPVLEPRAMVYVDPRAFTRLDPMATDTPLYYTVFSKQQLRVYPAPTAVYDLVHLFWGDGLLNCDVPRWIDVEICWHAVRLAQIRLQHDGAARAASEFQVAGMVRMAPLYMPNYESLDSYKMPVMSQASQQ